MTKEKQAVTDALNLLANELGLEETIQACRNWLREHTGEEVQDGERFFTKSQVYKAWKMCHGICFKCSGLMIDPRLNRTVAIPERTVGGHYWPYSRGGRTMQSNCIAIHARCNSEMGNLDPVQLAKRTGKTIAEVLKGTV